MAPCIKCGEALVRDVHHVIPEGYNACGEEKPALEDGHLECLCSACHQLEHRKNGKKHSNFGFKSSHTVRA